jgi:hypothetical protein
MDGAPVDPLAIPLLDDGSTHDVTIALGAAAPVGRRDPAAAGFGARSK